MQVTVLAPAKVNLHLEVKDRRPDGFHNLESIFLALDFGDILHFEPVSESNTVEIVMEWPGFHGKKQNFIPLEGNIIYKALTLFRDKTCFYQGFRIKVEKHVPMGGGLGGGSSDAAAALLTLNEIAGRPLNRNTLLDLAALLGSDVPFFIHETPAALITGRGELIKPIEAPCLFFVLVNPGFPSDTATAFMLLDKYRKSEKFNARPPTSSYIISNFSFFNDFLPVFEEREKTVYNEIISQLQELGAVYASLSGAGSTCFGVFENLDIAQKAAAALQSKWEFVKCCRIADAAQYPQRT